MKRRYYIIIAVVLVVLIAASIWIYCAHVRAEQEYQLQLSTAKVDGAIEYIRDAFAIDEIDSHLVWIYSYQEVDISYLSYDEGVVSSDGVLTRDIIAYSAQVRVTFVHGDVSKFIYLNFIAKPYSSAELFELISAEICSNFISDGEMLVASDSRGFGDITYSCNEEIGQIVDNVFTFIDAEATFCWIKAYITLDSGATTVVNMSALRS